MVSLNNVSWRDFILVLGVTSGVGFIFSNHFLNAGSKLATVCLSALFILSCISAVVVLLSVSPGLVFTKTTTSEYTLKTRILVHSCIFIANCYCAVIVFRMLYREIQERSQQISEKY